MYQTREGVFDQYGDYRKKILHIVGYYTLHHFWYKAVLSLCEYMQSTLCYTDNESSE